MLDLSKPEIEHAYRLGLIAGAEKVKVDADRAAQATEDRIVYELDRYRLRLVQKGSVDAVVVERCIKFIQGEVLND